MADEGADGIDLLPGARVPFAVCAAVGPTDITIAVNGVADAAKTNTVSGLPDLSAADLLIGPQFAGHIKQCLLYPEALAVADVIAATQ